MEQQKREVTWVKANELPESEKVFLKKDYFGWRVVEPYKNEDGSINWFIVLTGGKRNLAILIFLLIIVGLFYLGVHELINNYEILNSTSCNVYGSQVQQLNFSNLTI